MSQTKKIKKWLSQWEQKKVKEVVKVPNENAAKEEKSYVKPKMEEYLFGQFLRQGFIMADGPQVQLHIGKIGAVYGFEFRHALTSFTH